MKNKMKNKKNKLDKNIKIFLIKYISEYSQKMSMENKDTEILEKIENLKKTIDTATSILEYANKSYLEDVEKKRNGISSMPKHFDTHFFVFARLKQIYKKIKNIHNIHNILNDNHRVEIKSKLELYITAINNVNRYEGKIEDYLDELAEMLRYICDTFHITKFVGLLDGFVIDQRTNNVTMEPTAV